MNTRAVLIIEDNPLVRRMISGALRSYYSAIKVLEAADIATASRHLYEPHLDLVILDLHLPDGSGLLFLEQALKRAERECRVLVLTGDLDDSVLKRALVLGADDFLSKPVDFDVLESKVRSLLDGRYSSPIRFLGGDETAFPITLKHAMKIDYLSERLVSFQLPVALDRGSRMLLRLEQPVAGHKIELPVRVVSCEREGTSARYTIAAAVERAMLSPKEAATLRCAVSLLAKC